MFRSYCFPSPTYSQGDISYFTSLTSQNHGHFLLKQQWWQEKWQSTHKHGVWVLLANYSWTWSLPLSAGDTPFHSIKECWLFLSQLKIAYWVGVGLCGFLPFSMFIFFPLLSLQRSCACCYSLCEFICVSSALLCLENTVSLKAVTTSCSYNLSISSFLQLWALKEVPLRTRAWTHPVKR